MSWDTVWPDNNWSELCVVRHWATQKPLFILSRPVYSRSEVNSVRPNEDWGCRGNWTHGQQFGAQGLIFNLRNENHYLHCLHTYVSKAPLVSNLEPTLRPLNLVVSTLRCSRLECFSNVGMKHIPTCGGVNSYSAGVVTRNLLQDWTLTE
jgi:hypothetical protein